jgi:hypothetical protein
MAWIIAGKMEYKLQGGSEHAPARMGPWVVRLAKHRNITKNSFKFPTFFLHTKTKSLRRFGKPHVFPLYQYTS